MAARACFFKACSRAVYLSFACGGPSLKSESWKPRLARAASSPATASRRMARAPRGSSGGYARSGESSAEGCAEVTAVACAAEAEAEEGGTE